MNRVTRFNYIMGNAPSVFPNVLYEQIANQCKFLLEEVQETLDAASRGDIVEVVDGVADCEFVFDYIKTMVQSLGVQQDKAFEAVCDNNDLKYTECYEQALQWKKQKEAQGIECYVSSVVYEGVDYFMIRRKEDGKGLKFDNFPKVDLSPYTPKELINV